jgi:hypothetical protein
MMALSSWEVVDLAGGLRNPWGELRLISRLLQAEEPAAETMAVPVRRPALARAA